MSPNFLFLFWVLFPLTIDAGDDEEIAKPCGSSAYHSLTYYAMDDTGAIPSTGRKILCGIANGHPCPQIKSNKNNVCAGRGRCKDFKKEMPDYDNNGKSEIPITMLFNITSSNLFSYL
jgi:hypothetical protein